MEWRARIYSGYAAVCISIFRSRFAAPITSAIILGLPRLILKIRKDRLIRDGLFVEGQEGQRTLICAPSFAGQQTNDRTRSVSHLTNQIKRPTYAGLFIWRAIVDVIATKIRGGKIFIYELSEQ